MASFGTLSGSPTGRGNRLYEVVDNLSHQLGSHAFRAGVDFLYNDSKITYPRSSRGSYSFANLAAFLTGTYNASGFSQTFGDPVVYQTNPNVGFYAQDEWKVNSRFTLNLGLRYDLQFLETIRTDADNVSPRAGFAWTPFRSRHTVVRGSYGLYYDRVPLRAVANTILSANNTTDLSQLRQIGVSLSPAQTGAPVFPNTLPAVVPAVTLVNFSTMDRRMQNAYSEQGSFEIEQQLGNRSTVSAGYQHLRGLHLIISVNQNVPTCAARATTTVAARILITRTTRSTLPWRIRTMMPFTSPLCSGRPGGAAIASHIPGRSRSTMLAKRFSVRRRSEEHLARLRTVGRRSAASPQFNGSIESPTGAGITHGSI